MEARSLGLAEPQLFTLAFHPSPVPHSLPSFFEVPETQSVMKAKVTTPPPNDREPVSHVNSSSLSHLPLASAALPCLSDSLSLEHASDSLQGFLDSQHQTLL